MNELYDDLTAKLDSLHIQRILDTREWWRSTCFVYIFIVDMWEAKTPNTELLGLVNLIFILFIYFWKSRFFFQAFAIDRFTLTFDVYRERTGARVDPSLLSFEPLWWRKGNLYRR
jgi:hypothetical protein